MTKPQEDRRIDYIELAVADIGRSKTFLRRSVRLEL